MRECTYLLHGAVKHACCTLQPATVCLVTGYSLLGNNMYMSIYECFELNSFTEGIMFMFTLFSFDIDSKHSLVNEAAALQNSASTQITLLLLFENLLLLSSL